MHNMELVEGHGNDFVGGRAREGDAINRVYVVDSNELLFHQAEVCLLNFSCMLCSSQAGIWADVICSIEGAEERPGLVLMVLRTCGVP